jgi:chromosome segregation ATPase
MTEIIDKNRLIELVIEKHRRLLEAFNGEFSELNNKLNSLRQQSDILKKEMETTESKISVLNEKFHLLFYQAKKQREEIFKSLIENMRLRKSTKVQDVMRASNRIEEFEKKLQNSRNIEDEEKIINELIKTLHDIECMAKEADIIMTLGGIIDTLNDANSSHKELLSLKDKPEEGIVASKEQDKQIGEIEGRYDWLNHRIESHNKALTYWESQKGERNEV